MDNKTKYIEEDEIDLRELFKTIWDKKVFILVFTFIVTIGAIIYVSLKNPIPIYQGSVMVEIGEINNTEISSLDNSNTLKNVVEKFNNVTVDVIRRTTNLLTIKARSSNKSRIQKELTKSVDFILIRHRFKIKSLGYNKYVMTKQLGEINISDVPINQTKKQLIVIFSFITGFILSIFIVFFMQFIRGFKEDEKK